MYCINMKQLYVYFVLILRGTALCCVLELKEMSVKLMDIVLAENDQYFSFHIHILICKSDYQNK